MGGECFPYYGREKTHGAEMTPSNLQGTVIGQKESHAHCEAELGPILAIQSCLKTDLVPL